MQEITYETGKPSVEELQQFYRRQHHETTSSLEKVQAMVDRTCCVVVARREGEMVGLARGTIDGFTGRLAECKLDPSLQGPACVTRTDGRIEHDAAGIAAEMAVRVLSALRQAGAERVEVTAHGTEVDFCKELGFAPVVGAVAMALAPGVTPTVAVTQQASVG